FGLGLVYILLTVKISSFADFESLLIALANTYGLLLAIFCMVHGLVHIPRRIWQASSLDTSIRELQRMAVSAWEGKTDAEDVTASIVSVSIVWSEIVHNWTNPVLSLVGIVIMSTGRNWFLLEVFLNFNATNPDSFDLHTVVHGIRHIFKFHALEDLEYV